MRSLNAKNQPVVNKLKYNTKSANAATVQRNWYIVDADGLTLGRMSTQIAHVLRGKNKTYFTPHVDCGDYVIVVNAEKVHLSGNKWNDKTHIHHTGYPGGQREIAMKDLRAKKPEAIVENAVRGMLPKNKLGRAMYRKLFVYAGSDHPHTAQQPKQLINDK